MTTTIRSELFDGFNIKLTDEVYERALLSADEGSLDLVEYLIEEELIPKEEA